MRAWPAVALLAVAWLIACSADPSRPAEITPTERGERVVNPSAAPPAGSSGPTLTPSAPTPTQPAPPVPATGLLRLADFLDDQEGYCIDVAGFGANLMLDAPLQAHTCKPRSDDQLFSLVDGKGIRLDRHGRCLMAVEVAPDSAVGVSPCDAADAGQDFRLGNDGRIRIQSAEEQALCVGVAEGAGEPAGGRNHLRRDLMLYGCDEADRSLITWTLVEQ